MVVMYSLPPGTCSKNSIPVTFKNVIDEAVRFIVLNLDPGYTSFRIFMKKWKYVERTYSHQLKKAVSRGSCVLELLAEIATFSGSTAFT